MQEQKPKAEVQDGATNGIMQAESDRAAIY